MTIKTSDQVQAIYEEVLRAEKNRAEIMRMGARYAALLEMSHKQRVDWSKLVDRGYDGSDLIDLFILGKGWN